MKKKNIFPAWHNKEGAKSMKKPRTPAQKRQSLLRIWNKNSIFAHPFNNHC